MEKSLENFLAYCNGVKNLSRNTIKAYEADIGKYFEHLNGKDFSEATYSDFENFIISFKGCSANTVRRISSAVKSFYKWAIKNGICTNNPAEDIELPKLPKKVPEILSSQQIRQMIESCKSKGEFASIRDALIIELLFVTMIRREELLTIKLADVDTTECFILIHGKGNKERYCYFGTDTARRINHYIDKTRKLSPYALKSPYLFVSQCSGKLSATQLYNIVSGAMQSINAKKEGMAAHTLRRSGATNYYNKGADIYTISNALGHANIATTQRYVRPNEENIKRLMQSGNNIFKN